MSDLKVENPTLRPIVAKAGRHGGTFAVKEPVYAYAMRMRNGSALDMRT